MTAVLRVLVASADEGLRAQARLTLGNERFALDEAVDSDGVLHALAGEPPRLVILDLALPGSGALAIAATLADRAGGDRPGVLVLAPRGEDVPPHAPGVDAVLVVPTTSYALLRKVDALVGV